MSVFSFVSYSDPPPFFLLILSISDCVSVLIKRRLDVASVGSGNDLIAVPNLTEELFSKIGLQVICLHR